ncbi:hypothetical protein BDZ89DRAFT_1060424 [Hymenopellis radicata]|nr:hypothetical protein BDZ89DRAFT_1060424 [Hymenopellis radicata]
MAAAKRRWCGVTAFSFVCRYLTRTKQATKARLLPCSDALLDCSVALVVWEWWATSIIYKLLFHHRLPHFAGPPPLEEISSDFQYNGAGVQTDPIRVDEVS